ncbi:MAG: hypothetical protein LBH25_12225 [Fibromonadaceae bacterium]|nr:hypothetical protein [Fibromonadaceae bacterium]
MKKIVAITLALTLSTGIAFAQSTTARPIANGCGADGGIKFPAGEKGTAACNQHDKDYYNGVPKAEADRKLRNETFESGNVHVSGWAAGAKETGALGSGSAYEKAQKARGNSQIQQETWEKEHRQSLDAQNYKVVPSAEGYINK